MHLFSIRNDTVSAAIAFKTPEIIVTKVFFHIIYKLITDKVLFCLN